MRLLECISGDHYNVTNDLTGKDIPLYAILSHRWGPDGEEVTYRDLVDGTGKEKAGYGKLGFCAKQARRDGLRYFWIDTCCIDRTNTAELTEAINSLFRWFQHAEKCYVYLRDVHDGRDQDPFASTPWDIQFRCSRWFKSGWMLQELIAPKAIDFFSAEGRKLGDKQSLEYLIHDITKIPTKALNNTPLSHFTVAERESWVHNR